MPTVRFSEVQINWLRLAEAVGDRAAVEDIGLLLPERFERPIRAGLRRR